MNGPELNLFAGVVLATVLLDYLLGLVADLLNLRALGEELPERLTRVYAPEELERSRRYTRVQTRFGRIESTAELVLFLVFWWLGGFGWLDGWSRSLGYSPIVTGLVFIGALVVAKSLFSLPFRAWSTFVIEERFGFNRTTWKTFVLDTAKGALLTAALGVPLLAAILWFFGRAGELAWLYCWLVMSGLSIALTAIFPTWILPLFNRFEPLEEGELRDALAGYAQSVNFGLAGLFVIDGSRRSSRANAFFAGFGRNKRVALFDTLIESHTVPELVAVVAHEVGHYRKGHILKGMVVSVAHSGVMFFVLSLFLGQQGLFSAFGVANPSIHAGLVFFGMLYAPIELLLSLGFNALMRRNEFEADRFAVETVDQPLAMATALEKLSADNLSNPTPHPFYVALHYSHPPVLQRIEAIEARAAAG